MDFLEKVEQSGKWPQQACTTMFFLIPKNVTSERPIALMPTLIRWWEALRAPEVAKVAAEVSRGLGCHGWSKRRSKLGARGGKFLMEVERFIGKAKAEDQGAVALVPDVAKAFERVSLPVVRAWATRFSFPRKVLRVLCWYFEHRRVQLEGCAAEPLTTTAIPPGSKWSRLLQRVVLQDALSEVTNIDPSLKLRVFCG